MILILEEFNTPEILEEVRKHYDGLKKQGLDYKLPSKFAIHLTYPHTGLGMDGQLALKMDYSTAAFAYVNVNQFTGNCGMRSLTCVRCQIPALTKLWVTTIESRLAVDGFSVAVGSDGSQGGYATKTILEKADRGWQFIPLSQNRRTSSIDILVLIYKNIGADIAKEINWANAKPAPIS